MKAEYTLEVSASCPVDRRTDFYECVIRSRRTIPVEEILAAAAGLKAQTLFQEDLTRELHRVLGGVVETTGYHSGVKVVVTEGGRL